MLTVHCDECGTGFDASKGEWVEIYFHGRNQSVHKSPFHPPNQTRRFDLCPK